LVLPDDVDLGALKEQAESLAAVLRDEVPKYSRVHRAVALEPSAPRAIAALWEAIGWSEHFATLGMQPPEQTEGERRIRARLADYHSWGSGFTLTVNDLPTPRRLVEDDGQGVAFFVTDESQSQVDAPIVAVLADDNRLDPIKGSSYVRWCANHLIGCAFSRWYHVDLSVKPAGALANLGDGLYPLLTPAARRMTPDVVIVPPPSDQLVEHPHKGGVYHLAYRSPQALAAWVESVTAQELDFRSAISDYLQCDCLAEKLFREGDRLTWLPSAKGKRWGAGVFAGEPVIIAEEAGKTKMYINPRSLQRLKPIKDARVQD
jgi:hypothetical protein